MGEDLFLILVIIPEAGSEKHLILSDDPLGEDECYPHEYLVNCRAFLIVLVHLPPFHEPVIRLRTVLPCLIDQLDNFV